MNEQTGEAGFDFQALVPSSRAKKKEYKACIAHGGG